MKTINFKATDLIPIIFSILFAWVFLQTAIAYNAKDNTNIMQVEQGTILSAETPRYL